MKPHIQPACVGCKSECVKKNGFKKHCDRNLQLWECKKCGRQFTEESDTPFCGLHFSSGVVLMAVFLYVRYALSYPNVAEIMGFRGLMVADVTVREWVLKFGKYFDRAGRLKPRYSKIWHIDEKFIHAGRKPSKKYKRGAKVFNYLITVKDSEGNAVSCYLSPRRTSKGIKTVLKRALEEAGFSPDFAVHDSLNAYESAIKILGRNTRSIPAHFQKEYYGHVDEFGQAHVIGFSNNLIENHHSHINPKILKMRGIKSAEKTDVFFQAHRVFYNMTHGLAKALFPTGINAESLRTAVLAA